MRYINLFIFVFVSFHSFAQQKFEIKLPIIPDQVNRDSLAWRRVGITQRINTIGWMNIYNGTVGASGAVNAVDSANLIWGARAGQSLTTGYQNIAMGRGALKTTTTGHSLIAIGDSAMANGAITANGGIAIGQRALAAFVPHPNNGGAVAIGQNALAAYTGTTSNSAGSIAIGQNAGAAWVGTGASSPFLAIGRNAAQAATGTANFTTQFAIGDNALSNASYTGSANIAIGHSAGSVITTGSNNLIINNGSAITTGSRNTLLNNGGSGITTGSDNMILGSTSRNFGNSGSQTFIGSSNETAFNVGVQTTSIGGLANRSLGDFNTAIGYGALQTAGGLATPLDEDSSTAIGWRAGHHGSGTLNRGAGIYIGFEAAQGQPGESTGNELIAIGVRAAATQTAGNFNTAIGRVNLANTTGSNQLAIGGNGIGWIRQDVSGSLRRTLLNATTSNVTTFTPSTALEINGTNGAVLLPRLTTAQRDALTPTDGMIIYNTTTSKFQGRAGGAWVDLH